LQVVVIDEIGTEAEALAARTIAQRGVQLIATAHGTELANVIKNPALADLVGGIASVTLGDEEARRRGVQKSVLERAAPPTFDVCVEMAGRDRWRVHLDVAAAVDALLVGRRPGAEARERDADGRVFAWPDDAATDGEESDGDARPRGDGGGGGGARPDGGDAAGGKGARRPRAAADAQPFPELALAAARSGKYGGSAASALAAELAAVRAAAAADAPPPAVAAAAPPAAPAKAASVKKARTAAPPPPPLQLFLHGVDVESVRSVAEALGLAAGVAFAAGVQDADAVLATRPRLKAAAWVRGAAREAGVPVYAIASPAVGDVVRAVRTLLGVDPSPGGMFAGAAGAAAAPRADPRAARGAGGAAAAQLLARPEAAIAAVSSRARREALAEARAAIEGIVLGAGQAAELAPRDAATVEAQAALAATFGLECEVAGAAEGVARLRVLPASPARRAAPPSTPAAAKVDYW
jgi:hypothetical protein